MADHYVYVDPASGVDTTPYRGSDTAATAASTPYLTLKYALAAAITAGEQNRVTKAGHIYFRLLDGLDSYTATDNTDTIAILDATWTTSETYKINLVGYGTGKHNGNLYATGSGAGYTLRRAHTNSGNTGTVILVGAIFIEASDFRIQAWNTGSAAGIGFAKNGSYASVTLSRMLVLNNSSGGNAGGIIAGGAGWNSARYFNISDSVVVAGGHAITAANYGGLNCLNCTLISTGSGSAIRLDTADANIVKYTYGHAAGAAVFASVGSTWTDGTITRSYNAASDTTAYHATYDPNGLNSVPYSTSSGAYFTSVTAGSEDLSIGASSALKNAAVGSSSTLDVKSASRTTPDIGAYEYPGGASIAPSASFYRMLRNA